MIKQSVITWQAARHGGRSGLALKAAVALAACLVVRLVAAQAPAPSDGVVAEETDGQGYKIQVPLPALSKGPRARSEEQKYRSSVRQILGGNVNLNADPSTRRSFRGYFLQYLFPHMTTEDGQKSIGNDRQSFLRDVQNAKSKDAHAELVSITLPAMQKIVQDPGYRLTARYNAMLIIASLNDQEANNTSVPQTLPEPLPAALPFLLQQYRKTDNHDSIKIAALIGMARHLEFDNYKPPGTPIPAAGKAEIIKDLTALAEAKEAPAGRDAEVHLWMRRRAIDGLASACLTKPDAAIAATVEKLIKDEANPIDIRLAAASSLGRMSLQPPVKIDAAAAAKELGYLALAACTADLTRAEEYRKTQNEHEARLSGTYSAEIDYSGAGGMPGSGYGGGLGGESGYTGGLGGGMGGPGGGVAIRRPTPGSMIGGMPGGGLSDGGEIGGDYGSAGGMMNDPSMMDPKHYRVDYMRRRIRQHLYAVQQGLAGNDDFTPPRTAGQKGAPSTNPQVGAAKAASTDNANPGDKRGVYSAAKGAAEQEAVKVVYYQVRRLAEVIEVAGDKADFFQLLKDMRSELVPLEAMTKRLPPAGAANAVVDGDAPSAPLGRAGKAGPAKANPVKSAPPAVKGKAAFRPAPRPSVIAKPRFGR